MDQFGEMSKTKQVAHEEKSEMGTAGKRRYSTHFQAESGQGDFERVKHDENPSSHCFASPSRSIAWRREV
jgi:hypothetical protein